MKHLKEYNDEDLENLMGDLEDIGHGGPIGFMWTGIFTTGGNAGFIVIAKDEIECVKSVIENQREIFQLNYLAIQINDSPRYQTFDDLLDKLIQEDVIYEGTYFYGLKAKSSKTLLKFWYYNFIISPKYLYDQAKEYFKNADEILTKQGQPEDQIWTKT